MKAPKNVNVELLKNNSIRMSLVENVTNYPIKEQLRKLPIEQRDLLACYALLQTDREGVDVIVNAVNHNGPLPWPMGKVNFNKNETLNPIRYFEDVVYNLNYYKNQITTIIQNYDNGFEVQQSAVV